MVRFLPIDLGVDAAPVTTILEVFLADVPLVTELVDFRETFALLVGVAVAFAVRRLLAADLADF